MATTVDTFKFASLIRPDGTIAHCPACRDKRQIRCPNCGPRGHRRDGYDADGWCKRCDTGPQAPTAWRQIMCPCDTL